MNIMNSVKGVVTKVLSSPHYMFDKWCVDVKYNAHGKESETTLMFSLKESANSVDVGYNFKT